MTRNQFWILIAASTLLVVCLILQVVFSRQTQTAQARLLEARQIIEQGQTCEARTRQLAGRIYQVSQQQSDSALKDLLTRQQITVTVAPAASSAPAPAQAPSYNSAPLSGR